MSERKREKQDMTELKKEKQGRWQSGRKEKREMTVKED